MTTRNFPGNILATWGFFLYDSSDNGDAHRSVFKFRIPPQNCHVQWKSLESTSLNLVGYLFHTNSRRTPCISTAFRAPLRHHLSFCWRQWPWVRKAPAESYPLKMAAWIFVQFFFMFFPIYNHLKLCVCVYSDGIPQVTMGFNTKWSNFGWFGVHLFEETAIYTYIHIYM